MDAWMWAVLVWCVVSVPVGAVIGKFLHRAALLAEMKTASCGCLCGMCAQGRHRGCWGRGSH